MVKRPSKRRLDAELVRQGLFPDTETALRAILAGDVSTHERRLTSAGELVEEGLFLHVRHTLPYVSRGGLKLERALDAFDVSPEGLTCLDIGASSGGFTDCLLQRGALQVTSVDVGYAQFDWSLRNNVRVKLLERTNVTALPGLGYEASFDLAVCDVSFTSVAHILPATLVTLKPTGAFITLVKPQFEADKTEVDDGGVVTSAKTRLAALTRVAQLFSQAGLGPIAACESPIHGAKGNVEYLLFGRKGVKPAVLDLKAVVEKHTVVRV
ncbi:MULTISPECIES: TlyA family RNA methyltransferase [Atopobiaceae]|uniref:TlyA family RNA methyltransferase n=1 Tax=Atopobiaceae TaxID=1643824 RepID=UPI00034E4EF3|nr:MULTISPECIES: TlyA family RNA methyltransferase [Atopobiaceae]EPD78247.1 23S rRNA (-2'-O)/16S rRNA (-2'-O)-methyltransferase [Atopobium sp. oral taxon 199 str. F0494]